MPLTTHPQKEKSASKDQWSLQGKCSKPQKGDLHSSHTHTCVFLRGMRTLGCRILVLTEKLTCMLCDRSILGSIIASENCIPRVILRQLMLPTGTTKTRRRQQKSLTRMAGSTQVKIAPFHLMEASYLLGCIQCHDLFVS